MKSNYDTTTESIGPIFRTLITKGINTIAELSSSIFRPNTIPEQSVDPQPYDELKPYVRDILKNRNKKYDIVFLYMLTQFTMREYSGTEFYSSFCSSMSYPNAESESIKSFIRVLIKGTIEKYNLQDFGYFQSERIQYVECIKAHSFSYFSQHESFLDSARKIYEWLGCNIQEKDIVKRELFYIQQKVKQNSSISDDDKDIEITFGDDTSDKKAPRLSMVNSTCRCFSNVSLDSLMRLYFPILQLIDNWYYPDDEPNQIPEKRKFWIAPSYEKWLKLQNSNECNSCERKQKSPYRNHTPSFQISPKTEGETFKIVIPEITKEAQSIDSRWYCEIRSDGKTITDPFELIISDKLVFDNLVFWKSRQYSIDIKWEYIFSELSIVVYQSSDNNRNDDDNDEADEIIAEWTINKNVYRLFDKNGFQIKKIQANKENFLLVPHNSLIENKGVSIIRKSPTLDFDKIQFVADEDAAFKIGENAIISVAGQYYSEPFFAEERKSIQIEKDGKKITVSRRHPEISIRCLKGEERSIIIKINGIPRRPPAKIIPDISDNTRIIATFSVESYFTNNGKDYSDGLFTIEYGVEGTSLKKITYIILQSFAFHFSKPRFYAHNCELYVSKECALIPKDTDLFKCTKLEVSEKSYWQKYDVKIKPECEGICFDMEIGKSNVSLTIPVKKATFRFGYNISDAVFFRQQKSIPFTQIGNTMSVLISGAQGMTLLCNDFKLTGKPINAGEGSFSFDLTDIRNSCQSRIPDKLEVQYFDTQERKIIIWVHSIKPLRRDDCFWLSNDKLMYHLDELPSGVSCILDLFSENTDSSLFLSIPLEVSKNQELLKIVKNRTYWYRRKIGIPNDLPFLPDEIYYIDGERKPLIYFDIDNLTGTKMDIYDPRHQYNDLDRIIHYSVKIEQKILLDVQYTFLEEIIKEVGNGSLVYLGHLYEDNVYKWPIVLYDLRKSGAGFSCRISAFLHEENRCCLLEFNGNRLSPNPNALPSNNYFYSFDRNTFRRK